MYATRAQALRSYQQTAESYQPKQAVERVPEGEVDLSYYEQLANTIADALSQAADAPEEALAASVPPSAQPRDDEVCEAQRNAIQTRRERLQPLVNRYLNSLGVDPNSESGKAQAETTLAFYGRNDSLFARFEQLASTLGQE